MTMTQSPTIAGTKRPAWLLILTLPAFGAYLTVAVATIAKEVDSSSAELTADQLAHLGVWWMVLHVLWMTPSALAAIGLAQLAGNWSLRHAPSVRLFSVVALVFALAYLVVQVLALGFGGERWGDSSLYPLGVGLSIAVSWAGTLPATMLVAVGLARAGIARRTAWAVAVLIGLYWVVELVAYLPALLGPGTLEEAPGLPPFLLGIFWALLGGGLLRVRVPSGA